MIQTVEAIGAYVLFRGSSDQDGVPSRGAGWHARQEGVEALSRGLVEGDLLRSTDDETGGRTMRVMGSKFLLKLPPCNRHSLRQYTAEAGKLADDAGDWTFFWKECDRATWGAYLAGAAGVRRRLLLLAAADCVETVLGRLLRYGPLPARAVRLARRWGLGMPIAQEASDAATRARLVLTDQLSEREAMEAVGSLASVLLARDPERTVTMPIAYVLYGTEGGFKVDIDRINRSLSFLVRLRIPLGELALALATKRLVP